MSAIILKLGYANNLFGGFAILAANIAVVPLAVLLSLTSYRDRRHKEQQRRLLHYKLKQIEAQDKLKFGRSFKTTPSPQRGVRRWLYSQHSVPVPQIPFGATTKRTRQTQDILMPS